MGNLWPRSNSFEFDNNGVRAPGAKAYFYVGGTTTPLSTYSDAALTTAHTFPVVTDSYGRWPNVFLPFGTYDVKGTTSGGTQLFYPQNIPNPEPFDDSFSLDSTTVLNTGDIFFSLKNGTRTGAVRLNGRTIGNASSGATERASADTADLFAFLWGAVANGQAAVSGGRGANAAADFAAGKTLTLPDARGANLLGLDDMGNSAAGLLASAPVVSGGVTTAASILGANTHTITEAQLPAHTHSVSITSGNQSASHTHDMNFNSQGQSQSHTHGGTTDNQNVTHTHSYNTAQVKSGLPTGGYSSSGGSVWSGSDTTATSGNASADHTHTFASGNASQDHTHAVSGTTDVQSANHTHSVTGDTGSIGSGTAHNLVARSLLVTWFIKL